MMNDKPLTHFTHRHFILVGARFPAYKSIPVAQFPVQTIKRIDIIHAFNFSHTFGGCGGDGYCIKGKNSISINIGRIIRVVVASLLPKITWSWLGPTANPGLETPAGTCI